jgi:hypothetical protein
MSSSNTTTALKRGARDTLLLPGGLKFASPYDIRAQQIQRVQRRFRCSESLASILAELAFGSLGAQA